MGWCVQTQNRSQVSSWDILTRPVRLLVQEPKIPQNPSRPVPFARMKNASYTTTCAVTHHHSHTHTHTLSVHLKSPQCSGLLWAWQHQRNLIWQKKDPYLHLCSVKISVVVLPILHTVVVLELHLVLIYCLPIKANTRSPVYKADVCVCVSIFGQIGLNRTPRVVRETCMMSPLLRRKRFCSGFEGSCPSEMQLGCRADPSSTSSLSASHWKPKMMH